MRVRENGQQAQAQAQARRVADEPSTAINNHRPPTGAPGGRRLVIMQLNRPPWHYICIKFEVLTSDR